MTKVEKKVFKLSLLERYTEVGGHWACRCKLMEVDGIGLYVYHSEEHPYYITPGLVRRHLIGGRSTYCLVEANSEEEAKKSFLLNGTVQSAEPDLPHLGLPRMPRY